MALIENSLWVLHKQDERADTMLSLDLLRTVRSALLKAVGLGLEEFYRSVRVLYSFDCQGTLWPYLKTVRGSII